MLKSYFTLLLIVFHQLIGLCQINPKSPDYPYDDTPETKKIALQVTQGLTNDSLKVIAIYDWVIKSIDYDSVRYEKYFKTNIQEPTPKPNNCSVTLGKRKAICSGYAYLFSAMCEQLGIKAFPIIGYGRSQKEKIEKIPNHLWVTFKINDKWYLADPTWDSSSFKYNTRHGHKSIDYEFLMPNPQFFSQTHFPLDPMWQLVDNPMTFSFWKNDASSESVAKFNFNFSSRDTLNKFEVLDKQKQFISSMNRIAQQDESAFYGLGELFVYYGKIFEENAVSYDNIRRKIVNTYNNKNGNDITKNLVNFKQELLPRLNLQERRFREIIDCYNKLTESISKNNVPFLEINSMKSNFRYFRELENGFIEERKLLNTTIRHLESLRKK